MEAETLPSWTATLASEYKVIGGCYGVCPGIFDIGSGIRIAIDNQSVTVGGRVAIWEK